MATASPIPPNPSDALATIARAMIEFMPDDPSAWQRELNNVDPGYDMPEEWRVSAEDICISIVSVLGSWPPPAPANAVQFANYARQLQRLDRWHLPVLATSIDLERSRQHNDALDRAFTLGRFNSNDADGSIILRESPDTPFLKAEEEMGWGTNPGPLAVINSLLDTCAYLPVAVQACDPDDASHCNARLVRLEFRRFPAGAIPHRQFRKDFRLAVAPVLEATSDAELWVDGDRYSIHPTVSEDRLVAIVRDVIASGADLLLMPEMCVDETYLPSLQKAITQQRHEYYQKTGKLPGLAFAICGVLRKRSGPSDQHRNYIVALDSDGTVLFEQDKLSHWNLTASQQRRFGIFGGYPVPLLEDTSPGESITIAELPGLGRMLTLICADMSADEPGDWVADNVGLDWLHAPVMDGSIYLAPGNMPWIVERAARAAARGTATIVTNSMTLTHWNNAANRAAAAADPAFPHGEYDQGGIALAVAPIGVSVKMQYITEDLASPKSPVLQLIAWDGSWVNFA